MIQYFIAMMALIYFLVGKEPLELLHHIYNICEADQGEAKLGGLTQVSLQKFLFGLLAVSALYPTPPHRLSHSFFIVLIYHDTYPTKNIWNDTNIVELLSLKELATDMMGDLDGIL